MKLCPQCNETKQKTEFYKNGKYLAHACKMCAKKNTRSYAIKNKEKIAAYHREYYYRRKPAKGVQLEFDLDV